MTRREDTEKSVGKMPTLSVLALQFIENQGSLAGAYRKRGTADTQIIGRCFAASVRDPHRCTDLSAGHGPVRSRRLHGGRAQPFAAVHIQIVPHTILLAPELSGFIVPVGQRFVGGNGIGGFSGYRDHSPRQIPLHRPVVSGNEVDIPSVMAVFFWYTGCVAGKV